MENSEITTNGEFKEDNESQGYLKNVLDLAVSYMKSIGATINYDLKEISVFPDSEFLFEALSFMPYYFPWIKEGDKFKLIIDGNHSYNVIFKERTHQTEDHILRVGWLVDLMPLQKIQIVEIEINIKNEELKKVGDDNA